MKNYIEEKVKELPLVTIHCSMIGEIYIDFTAEKVLLKDLGIEREVHNSRAEYEKRKTFQFIPYKAIKNILFEESLPED